MPDRPATLRCDVVILGGGPTGLCAALELNRQGVDAVVVERRRRHSTVYPTANHLTARSMEMLRIWGVADRVRTGGFPPDHPDGRFFLSSVDAAPVYSVVMDPNSAPPASEERVAEGGVWCPRPYLDPVLIDAIEAADHVTLLDGHEIVGVREDDVVTTSVTDAEGAGTVVESRWALVAEGASSTTRAALGIGMAGLRIDRPTVDSLLFDAPGLSARLPERGTQYWFLGPREATVVSIDGRDRFRAHVPMRRLGDQRIEEYLADLLDGEIRAVARFPWSPGLLLADRYREGHAFLIGDAAHVVTPYGGLGMNTGLEDAMNVASKIGAVCAGWAAPTLLDDYELERRPVARELLRYQGLTLDGEGGFTLADPLPLSLPALPDDLEHADDDVRAEAGRILRERRHLEFVKPGLELGIEYPVDGVPASTRGPREWAEYDPVVRAGTRAPHVVADDGSVLVDELRRGDVVVVGGGAAVDDVAGRCADARVPVRTLVTSDPVYAGWSVVRPDGFVVAHGDDETVTDESIGTVLTRLHARSE